MKTRELEKTSPRDVARFYLKHDVRALKFFFEFSHHPSFKNKKQGRSWNPMQHTKKGMKEYNFGAKMDKIGH